MERNLGEFDSRVRDYSILRLVCWYLVQNLLFNFVLTPGFIRIKILRLFGATIGGGNIIRKGVRVHFPWNLKIGNSCWIGEDVWFINHAEVEIGSNVCISQGAIICSSGHDYKSESMSYRHSPIRIEDGVWICLRSNVMAGSTIGRNGVVSAGETIAGILPENHLFIRGNAKPILNLD